MQSFALVDLLGRRDVQRHQFVVDDRHVRFLIRARERGTVYTKLFTPGPTKTRPASAPAA